MPAVATNARIWLDGYDLSGDYNALADVTVNPGDRDTAHGATVHTRLPGIPETEIEWGGYWASGAGKSDTILRPKLGIADSVLAYAYAGAGAAGEVAYFCKVSQGQLQVGPAEVNRVIPFRGSAFLTGDGHQLIRGTVLHNAAVSSDGNGTAYAVGAVGATQYVYACLHVLAISGTLDVIVQSDTVGFPSATNRITFAQASAVGAQYATRVAGAITDTYWRVSYTRSGTATFVVVVGIQ